MELWKGLLISVINEYDGERDEFDLEKLFDKGCYRVLKRIKAILEDDNIEDKECFERIESIVCLFEEVGTDCGARHDFS